MRITPLPQSEIDEAERKVGAILDELEDDTHSDVKDIDLEDVIETDKDSGKPALGGVDGGGNIRRAAIDQRGQQLLYRTGEFGNACLLYTSPSPRD